jgi:hypothetical protein
MAKTNKKTTSKSTNKVVEKEAILPEETMVAEENEIIEETPVAEKIEPADEASKSEEIEPADKASIDVENTSIDNSNIEEDEETKTDDLALKSEAKRIKRILERTNDRIDKEKQKCREWTAEGERLLAENDQKFEADKVKKILQLKEEDNISAIEVLQGFYISEVERLTNIKNKKEAAGETGEFSKEYQKYLKQRSERYEKRVSNIKKSWIIYSDNYLAKKLPPLESKIDDLNSQLTKIEEELPKTEV